MGIEDETALSSSLSERKNRRQVRGNMHQLIYNAQTYLHKTNLGISAHKSFKI